MSRRVNKETQERIYQLHFLWGWTQVKVAEMLKMNVQTVRNYAKRIQADKNLQAKDSRPEFDDNFSWQWKINDFFNECMSRINSEYHKAQTPKEKIMCLNAGMEAFKAKLESLQSVGRSPKVKDKDKADTTVIYNSFLAKPAEQKPALEPELTAAQKPTDLPVTPTQTEEKLN